MHLLFKALTVQCKLLGYRWASAILWRDAQWLEQSVDLPAAGLHFPSACAVILKGKGERHPLV